MIVKKISIMENKITKNEVITNTRRHSIEVDINGKQYSLVADCMSKDDFKSIIAITIHHMKKIRNQNIKQIIFDLVTKELWKTYNHNGK